MASMSQEEFEATYYKVKKRLREYKILNSLASFGVLIFALLAIFSFVPIIPLLIIQLLHLTTLLTIPAWIVCLVSFAWAFNFFQKKQSKIEETLGITLEEKMFASAYESLCFMREYLDPEHPILGSKRKAVRKLKDIDYVLNSTELPELAIINQEKTQLELLETNLINRLVPAIERIKREDSSFSERINSALNLLVGYLVKPELKILASLNDSLASFDKVNEKGAISAIIEAVSKHSNTRHVIMISGIGLTSILVAYVDFYHFAASASDAFTLGIGTCVGVVAVYATYLGLTKRK